MNFYGNRAIIRKKVDFGLVLDAFLKSNFEKKNVEKIKKKTLFSRPNKE